MVIEDERFTQGLTSLTDPANVVPGIVNTYYWGDIVEVL